ncbi:putative sulfonate ABC transporter, periplasmic sulfonate-binding protein [Oceanicola granulosus HTCC2516]|uniref:Putative sulfonate ABC transporter, periplasmic sulfonate-binding protein n=1 Tax=Oceanicola granulosus (strain ATCC BAA-861 / DSM 15982 / KCTC 12143 / HTCC2516) TaxID=314256 RepID=Q2CI90_OCEGH|nr:ABC transporter substrate-binding protein [Oceanicola granulosus]EAR52368.1 putative sulfonate ABC transporter, periplasmic sulfonate-binding protein [Oceanicola granulosus HTCC2516]
MIHVIKWAAGLTFLSTVAAAQDLPEVEVGVLSYGTAQWEMKVIQDHGLDEAHGVELVLRDLGSEQAGDVALQTGDVDIILTDFIWVSIQRNEGRGITLVPHSRAVGGLMVPPGSSIAGVDDLPGRTIGIAGGPVDKSWIILQAYYAQRHDDPLADAVEARFGAPPLVNELLASGELDASLNFWHWNARAKAAGMSEVISVADMLGALGISEQAPLLGWAFTDETAATKPEALRGFLDASFAAKRLLLEDDEVWEGLREVMRASGDDALFAQLRDDYRAGIIASFEPAIVEAAGQTFEIMAEFGGADLVGETPTMAEGTFWTDY